MSREALSPVQEYYKGLPQDAKELLQRYNIRQSDISDEGLLKLLVVILSRIERLEINANLPN